MKGLFLRRFCYLVLALSVVVFYGCDSEPIDSNELSDKRRPTRPNQNNGAFDLSQNCDVSSSTNLYAGQNILVGEVTVDVVDDNYIITYNMYNSGYCLTETHLSVVDDANNDGNPDFPLNGGGNPKIGQFEYSGSHDCVSSVEYTVPVSKGTFIAAHAVVNCTDTFDETELYASFPATQDFCLRTGREVDNWDAYFRLTINEGPLEGVYAAWCADVSLSIDSSGGEDVCYEDFNVYTANDDLTSIISEIDNLDNVLFLINNLDNLDEALGLAEGTVLYGYVQWAMWKLLNDQECVGCNANLNLPAGDYTIIGKQIVAYALENGDGYTPECDDYTIFVLDDGSSQPIIAPYKINCNIPGDCDETAWGVGCDFPGNSWAMYFNYSDAN